MSISTSRELLAALNRDFKKPGSKRLCKVIDDPARKIFIAKQEGVVFEFAHKQPDAAFWNGVKYYGSGTRSKFRMRRSDKSFKLI